MVLLNVLVQCWATVCDAGPTLYHHCTISSYQLGRKTENNTPIIDNLIIYMYSLVGLFFTNLIPLLQFCSDSKLNLSTKPGSIH